MPEAVRKTFFMDPNLIQPTAEECVEVLLICSYSVLLEEKTKIIPEQAVLSN